MLRPEAQRTAADRPNHERRVHAAARHEAVLGDRVHDLVETHAKKIGEHDLDHGPIAREGEPERSTDEGFLGDRGVTHACRPKLLEQTERRLQRSLGLPDVLAQDQDARVGPHLIADRPADSFAITHELRLHDVPVQPLTRALVR